MYKRNCPICNKEIEYKSRSRFRNAEKNNIPCLECANKNRKYTKYVRNCPICNKQIQYKKQETFDIANEYNELCKECSKNKDNLKITKLVYNCPQCGKEMYYSNHNTLQQAKRNNVLCNHCMKKNLLEGFWGFNRNCPECGRLIGYASKESMLKAENDKKICSYCAVKKSKLINSNFKKKCPQCGKEITYTSQRSLDESIKQNKVCLKCSINKPETKEKMRKSHVGHKNLYDIWVDEYGKEIADEKYKQHKQKISMNADKRPLFDKWVESYGEDIAKQKYNKFKQERTGKNNPMYGKPAPHGSGNGWSGHYKGMYFRSLLELYYLIYLIDNNIKFENGELKKHTIKYTMDGIERNYFPDFYLIDTQETIEIKPKNLIGTYQNKLKFVAAKQKLGNKHVILTEDEINKIDVNRLWDLYINKELQFDKRYVTKFENYCRERNDRVAHNTKEHKHNYRQV